MGGGCFGRVYLARRDDGKHFAIKIFEVQADGILITKKKVQEAFQHEQAILQKISSHVKDCPFLVKLEESFEDMNTKLPCLVLTPVVDKGKTLEARMSISSETSSSSSFSPSYTLGDIYRWAKQFANGLEALHALCVVHFDLAPKNLLLHAVVGHANEDILIGDFGTTVISRRSGPVPGSFIPTDSCFVPPEVRGLSGLQDPQTREDIQEHIKHHYNGPKYDMWGYGVILYLLVQGRGWVDMDMDEIDKLAKKEDLRQQVLMLIQQDIWGEKSGGEIQELEQQEKLSKVISGTLCMDPGSRMSAPDVVKELKGGYNAFEL